MELYLIRHAEAVELGEQGITTDEERPLTSKGERQAEDAARALRSRGVVLDTLLTSPLVRARQTADILQRVWDQPTSFVQVCDELSPGVKMRKLSKALMKMEAERVGLVGHMPQLGDFTAWLLGEKSVQIDLAKAGVALVVCGDAPGKGLGSLQWLVTPEWYTDGKAPSSNP